MLFKKACIVLICTVTILQAYAQPAERGLIVKKDTTIVKGNTYAIIVGISNYKEVPHLQYAHKDAQAFESYLLSDAGGKVPKENIETFLNENAIRYNVADAINIVIHKAKPGDRVYFFFAGHGDMEDLTQIENGLLLLYNSPNGNYFGMNDDVLQILQLKNYLGGLAQKGIEMIFIVDACHSGNLKGGIKGSEQTASALAASWGNEYKLLSCQPNQSSLESAEWGGGRGLFSLELEEGMKGLSDKNNDGKVSFMELQRYITDNVATYSEDKQIPLVSGDLSKLFVTVNPATLAALKKQKEQNYPILAKANIKGNEEKYIDSLDPAGKKIYSSFKKNLDDKKLIWPKDTNALRDYRAFVNKYYDNLLIPNMRRSLAASLNERFNLIVAPLLRGETSSSSRDECKYAAAELDSCLHLLGEQHYMYTNLKARKLYMDAMALTWAMTKNEYNISIKPVIEKAIQLLEQSEKLEPNAAYTLQQLGILYCDVFEYEKAYPEFQKYLDLRPNDFYSKYSLAAIFASLNMYDKAGNLYLQLIKEFPTDVDLYASLANVYMDDNKEEEALKCAKKIIVSLHDKSTGYFVMGVCYSHKNIVDSAVRYYKLSAKEPQNYLACYNNIGHIYFLNNQVDSAKKYFTLVLKKDSTFPNTNFNMGIIDDIRGDTYTAISKFIRAINNFNMFDDCFNTNMQLYFKKNYNITNVTLYEDFKKKAFNFNSQYLCYLGILYCYLRDENLKGQTDKIGFIFSQMFNYKQHDPLTWYHYACYKALNHDKNAALESIEKALKLGFGNYFMLSSDSDLDLIRNTPEFKKFLQKYFPAESKN